MDGSRFVLVHGAWHGSWCWDKIVCLLEEAGHQVDAPDLPGHGGDLTPPSEVTLQAYVDRVCEVLDAQPEPAVLVGHSMGGTVISQVAEQLPDKIATLVYLTGFLLPNGTPQMAIARADTESVVTQSLVVREEEGVATIQEYALIKAFYGDCSEKDFTRAKSLLVAQPLAPLATPVETTEGRFGRVPRVYIECLRDQAITPATQKKMYTELPCQKVISMNTSHSPFFSAPEALTGHLIRTSRLACLGERAVRPSKQTIS